MKFQSLRWVASLTPLVALLAASAAAPGSVSYRESVEPILRANCTGCHSKAEPSGGFSVDSPDAIRKGGVKFGIKMVVPGKPKESALIGYLRGTHQPQMPMGAPPLPEAKIKLIEQWITEGAVVDEVKTGWPYLPPVNVSAPPSTDATNPIDRFVEAKLAQKGLKLSAPAPKGALARRVYLDTVGMPPTPKEVDAFLSDTAPGAYERLVDRLLNDPRYGERWARHWLDLVRYAETHGFEADNIRPHAWRYRDYVIRAFNSDKPYDRFLQEQIAGDEMFPQDGDAWIATGFLRLGSFDELSRDGAGRRQDTLNDATDTLGSAVLGMTVGCARCHDHKYDRISQRDYYRMQAFFATTRWTEQRLPTEVDSPALVAKREAARTEAQQANKAMDDLRAEIRVAMSKPDANDDAMRTWLDKPEQKDRKAEWEKRRIALENANRTLTPIDNVAEVVTDTNATPPTHHVLLRGNVATPGDVVTPGFITAFCGTAAPDAAFTKTTDGRSSGARTSLARWLTDPKNPMTARVIVNRLWQHHFGTGLVGTPSDFGVNGEKTEYAPLLDWMANDLVRQKWSLKAVQRLILTSKTYRQSVGTDAKAQKADPQNHLLWRQNRQRLEAEAIRDSILAVSGGLNPEMGGPSIYPALSSEVLSTGSTNKWGNSPEDQQRRRTIYVFQRRSLSLPIAEVFDGPDMVNTCPRRNRTTIAPQALALFNGDFGWTEARRFADRIQATGGSVEARVELAYRLALVRRPTANERTLVLAFLLKKQKLHESEGKKDAERLAWVDFCHVLFNTNEFVYTD